MSIHDWTRVEAGVFHDFHHGWIEEIKRALNGGILPEGYYALAELLDHRIHLLILDLHPPTPRDPQGIHGAVWEEITAQEYAAAAGKPLTLAAYESGLSVRAYVEPVAVGDTLTNMPLFLEPGAHVLVPLEATYQRAFAALPRRWRVVLERSGPGEAGQGPGV